MASGLAMERADQYRGKLTSHVSLAAIVVTIGGSIFGYVGTFGQSKGHEIFYEMFYTDAFERNPRDYNYCKYSGRSGFPVYVAPLYLAGCLAILVYPLATKLGRRKSMILAASVLFVGGAVGVYPAHLAIFLTSQIVLGFGIGFGIQVILIYLSEIAPAHSRGALNGTFQWAVTLGILLGVIPSHLPMIYPTVLAFFMIIGAAKILPETPSSLVEQGSNGKARQVLKKMRGTEDVDAEFQDIVEANEFAGGPGRYCLFAMKNVFWRRNRPGLVMAVLMPMFQNLTGVVFVFAYGPLMFWSSGHGKSAALYSTAINGSALAVSALASIATVDRLGRKPLLISGGVVMFLCQVIIAVMLGSNLFSEQLSRDGISTVVTVFIAVFVLAFGWSWGPLGWTIPSEIFTLETRTAGIAIAVSVNLLFAYIVLQFFIPFLCAFKYGLFLFFGGCVVVMTVFVCFFVPETKGVPVEEMGFLWPKHWFWKRFVGEDS